MMCVYQLKYTDGTEFKAYVLPLLPGFFWSRGVERGWCLTSTRLIEIGDEYA